MDNISQNPFEQKELKLETVITESVPDENLFKEEIKEKKKLNITKEMLVKIISFILLIITLALFIFFLYKVIKTSSKEYELDKIKFTINSDYNVSKTSNKLELKKDNDLVTISLIKEENMLSQMKDPAKLKEFMETNHLTCKIKDYPVYFLDCQKEGETVLLLHKKDSDHLLISIKGQPILKEEIMKIAMNARYS